MSFLGIKSKGQETNSVSLSNIDAAFGICQSKCSVTSKEIKTAIHKKIKSKKIPFVSANTVFKNLINKFTKAGALLKGLRSRENLTQAEFAKKIKVTQANLSKMETGKRPIGKIIAKRIEKVFGTHYRYFLE